MNVFGTTWSIWIPFWRPLDFEEVPKSIVFAYNQSKVIKKGVQEGVLKKHIFGLILDAKMGGLEEPKQAFRIRPAAQYEFSRL